jgi:hypothetical protein
MLGIFNDIDVIKIIVILIIVVVAAIAAAIIYKSHKNKYTFVNGGMDIIDKKDTRTYYFPEDNESVISEIALLNQKKYIYTTIYYKKKSIAFSYGKLPKLLGYNPKIDIVHNEHDDHVAELHKVDDPFTWHVHIRVKKHNFPIFLDKLLRLYDPRHNENHIQIINLPVKSAKKIIKFPNNAYVKYGNNEDTSGIGVLADIKIHWKPGKLKNTKKNQLLVLDTINRIRVGNADQILEILFEHFSPKALASLTTNKGYIQHHIVESGNLKAVKMIFSHPEFNVDTQRSSDKSTSLHLAKYYKSQFAKNYPNSSKNKSNPYTAIIKYLMTLNPNLSLKNKYG